MQIKIPFNMRYFLLLVTSLFVFSSQVYAQGGGSNELGVTIGGTSFLGDLGGSSHIGKGFIADLDFLASRPGAGIFLRNNLTPKVSLRHSLTYGQVFGDDGLTNADAPGQGGWPRKYRNLSFRSHIIELASVIEYNLLPFVAGSMRYRFTPYLVAGAGIFHFDPKANYNGSWVRLQPLGTEGQGLPQFPEKDKYSLISFAFPFGAGIKLNMNRNWTLYFEIAHRMTTTDYIDDVSTVYVDPSFFYAFNDPATADLVAALADRSSGDQPNSTAAGQQRGDPSDFDTYTFMSVFSIAYIISNKSGGMYSCPKGMK